MANRRTDVSDRTFGSVYDEYVRAEELAEKHGLILHATARMTGFD